ncbi:hypothetical protein QEN19_004042 [Hanseniaspora menglaensis]
MNLLLSNASNLFISASFKTTAVSYFGATRSISIINDLYPNEAKIKKDRKLGRGPSSSKGRTSGRGMKGQKARNKVRALFEGGQTPQYLQLPKVGKNIEFLEYINRPMAELPVNKIVDFYKKGRLTNFLMQNETPVLDVKAMHDLGLVTLNFEGPHSKHSWGVRLIKSRYQEVPEVFKQDGSKEIRLPANLKIEATKATLEAIDEIENIQKCSIRTVYHTPMTLRGLIAPWTFMNTLSGKVPPMKRPGNKKDYLYYTNPLNRGYLSEGNFKTEEDAKWVQRIDQQKARVLEAFASGKQATAFGESLEDQLLILKGEYDAEGNKIEKS